MQNSYIIFEDALQKLIKDYFVEEDGFDRIFHDSFTKDPGTFSSKISDIYKKQLDIKLEDSVDRIHIDRAVTYAQKKLEKVKFYQFTLELGNICIAAGKINLAQELFNKISRKSDDKKTKAHSLIGLADICSRTANWTRGIALVTEAENIFKENNDNTGLANCFNMLGSISGEMGEIERAKNYFNQSLLFATESSEKDLNAKIETNLGIVNSILGNVDEAIIHFETALAIYNETGDFKRVADLYLNIGLNFLRSENPRAAISAFDKGIELSLENRFIGALALLYLAKAEYLINSDDILSAKDFADKALSLSHSLDDRLTIADIYKIRGIIARELKDFATAESYLMISLRINQRQRSALNEAETAIELGIYYQLQSKYDQSNIYFNQALAYFRKNNAKDKILKVEKLLLSNPFQFNSDEVKNEK